MKKLSSSIKLLVYLVALGAVALACLLVVGNEKTENIAEALTGNGGRLIIEGGATYTLSGNISGGSANDGGNVHISSGTFTMSSGTISNGVAETATGGGVCLDGKDATFIMNGGTISGNDAFYSGGGVGVYNSGGTFTMNGGTITGNNAGHTDAPVGGYGGGVAMHCGVFNMNGGTIEKNTSRFGSEYQVYVDSAATFNYKAGTINGKIQFYPSSGSGRNIIFKGSPTSTLNFYIGSSITIGTKFAKLDGISTFDLTKLSVSGLPSNSQLELQTISGVKYLVVVPKNITVTFQKPTEGGSFSVGSISVPYKSNVSISGGDTILAFSETTSSGESIFQKVNYTLPASTAQYEYTLSCFQVVGGSIISGTKLTQLTSNVTIKAVVSSSIRNYDITIKLDGYGSLNDGSTSYTDQCVINVPYGSTVAKYMFDGQMIITDSYGMTRYGVITAYPNSYRVFKGFFVDGEQVMVDYGSYTIESDVTITAKIVWDTVTVYLDAEMGYIHVDGMTAPNGSIKVRYFGNVSAYTPANVLAYSTAEETTAYANADKEYGNYYFKDWYIEGQGVLSSSGYSIGTGGTSITITARFAKKTFAPEFYDQIEASRDLDPHTLDDVQIKNIEQPQVEESMILSVSPATIHSSIRRKHGL